MTRIVPTGGWRLLDLRELWRFRELLFFLIWRDVKVRYRQTELGVAWAVLQPVLMMAVFTVFFGRLAGMPSAGLPYPLFAFAGLLPWMFFAAAVGTAGNSVVGAERLITKIYFPRLAIPIAAVGVAVVDLCIAIGVLGILMAWYGVVPGAACLLAIPIGFVIALAGFGFGTGLAALNVRYRDFRYVIPFMVQFWMFATPTVYMQPPADASGVMSVLMWVNPLTGLIDGFRAACLGLTIPWCNWVRLLRLSWWLPLLAPPTSARSKTTLRISSEPRFASGVPNGPASHRLDWVWVLGSESRPELFRVPVD